MTAIAEGTANILVSCGDYAATCLVTVTLTPEEEQDNPEAQGEGEGATQGEEEPEGEMELSATDITMTYPGELARLYVNNSGDKEVTWSTDNETLLTVDSTGLIMARATGAPPMSTRKWTARGLSASSDAIWAVWKENPSRSV